MAINHEFKLSSVSISQFSNGQTLQIFDQLENEHRIVILKEDVPVAVLLCPEEFERLSEIEEDYRLLLLAQKRLVGDNLNSARNEADILAKLGITEDDIKNAADIQLSGEE